MHAAINTADLDPLGNWSGFDEDTDGDSTDDLTQSRTTNAANEITDITEGGGQTAWATPAYDASGNMIEIPQPSDPANEFAAMYDAWGRLVKLEDGANTVAEYEYDGLGRRIIKHIYAPGSGAFDYSDHAYYTGWQVVEVRRDTDSTKGGDPDADPMEQLVYHPYYIDAVAVRYWDDPDDGGGLDGTQVEQYYAHDAQFSVIALMDDTGTILERYRYTPYGEQVIMDASFDDDYDSDGDPTDNVSQYGQTKGFTGQTLDPESGLWYFRARYYSDGLGGFVSRDPIGYRGGGMNLQASYFGMLGGTDPMGEVSTNLWYGPSNPAWQFDFLLTDFEATFSFMWFIDGLDPNKEHAQLNLVSMRWGDKDDTEDRPQEASAIIIDWIPAGTTMNGDQQALLAPPSPDICHLTLKTTIFYESIAASSGTQFTTTTAGQRAPMGLEVYMLASSPFPISATQGPDHYSGVGMAGVASGDVSLIAIEHWYSYENYTKECCEYWGEDWWKGNDKQHLIIEQLLIEGIAGEDYARFRFASDPGFKRDTAAIQRHSEHSTVWVSSIRDSDFNVVRPGYSVYAPHNADGTAIQGYTVQP